MSAASIPIPLILQRAEDQRTPEEAATVAKLTRALAAGDEEAFARFHELYFDRLYRFLLSVAQGDEPEAREAMQETLLRVVRHARQFDSEEVFWCWLKNLARSAARDGGRKRRRYLSLLRDFAAGRREPASDDSVEEERLGALLEESLGELDPEDRRMIEDKYIEGMTIRELSGRAGLTERAVESRLLRLRRGLRERMLKKLRTP